MAAKIISFINYKGGVGKTTTTYHIGSSLAQHHAKHVLLVDIDPQTNLTFLCAPYEKWEQFKSKNGTVKSIYDRFQKRQSPETKRSIWKQPIRLATSRIANLDLIPCDIDLLGEDLGGGQIHGTYPTMELLRRSAKEYMRERRFLRTALKDVANEYDYILIDCPPNLYLMTQNALVASQWYVVTAIPDHLSTIGLSILQRKVGHIRDTLKNAQNFAADGVTNGIAELGGVVFVKVRVGGTMITNTHHNTMQKVRTLLGKEKCFGTYTTELIGFGEAAENSLPVWEHQSSNAYRAAGKQEYQSICDELITRF